MINSFMSIDTITRGLLLQQLEQEINASNLANPSQDANGYLINSLQRANVGQSAPLIFNNSNGMMAVGTGPLVQSITRLRDSFLDSQIQQESSLLGQAEILANSLGTGILNQINAILGATTLSGALNTFSAAWASLGANANPSTDNVDRAAVVNGGVAFAQLANNQFNQLENLSQGNLLKINDTVSQINGILQQLSSINKQLLNSQGASNVNSLLDARDYALDQLSRRVNIQTNFGVAGTVSVYLGGSSVTLVDFSGAAIFQTNVQNPHYPDLTAVTIQSPEGGLYNATGPNKAAVPNSMAQWITGGNLGGELQAQNKILSYMAQLDQIATSVMNVTNSLNAAGYAADGVTTGTAFFTGTGAVDISVNAAILNDATHNLVAASISPGTPTNGQVAKFLGNLQTILANNFVESDNQVAAPGSLNPTTPIGVPPNSLAFASPVSATGSFTVNGVTINWANTDSIDGILNKINSTVPNVYAVFNQATSQFFMYSNKPINIVNVTGNFTTWGNIANTLTSTIRMNNYEAPNMPLIDASELPPGPPFFGNPPASSMNSTKPGSVPDTGPNSIAFKVVPSPTGIFKINGNTFVWNNTMSLAGPNPPPATVPPTPPGIGGMINLPPATYTVNGVTSPNPYPGWAGTSAIAFSFDPTSQTITLTSTQNGAFSPQPIQLTDLSGNFSVFTGLNGNTPIGSLASGLSNQINTDTAGQQLLQSQASNSLNQLNTAQANIAGVATGSGPGVPIANIQQQAMQSLITYNALLQVLQVIDNMYADLVNMVGGPSPSFFHPRP